MAKKKTTLAGDGVDDLIGPFPLQPVLFYGLLL